MLYIHVPFCAQRCIYCDFYTTTKGQDVRQQYVVALCKEISTRANELPSHHLESIYFGGGTPSLLTESDFAKIFDTISQVFSFSSDTEITVESNPDDISPSYISMLRQFQVNRLSMGVQSFNQKQLSFLRRRHTAEQALQAISHCITGGINNISIDLIYGLPHQTLSDWEQDIEIALSTPITHLSAYSLIYEEETPLYRMRAAGQVQEAEEGLSYAMYEALLNATSHADWEHYEISNFSKQGLRSRHNSAYWKGIPYLGCGPAAHSFNGKLRRHNHPSVTQYNLHIGNPPHEVETLSTTDCMNERLLTALRMSDGLSLSKFASDFGEPAKERLLHLAQKHLRSHNLLLNSDTLSLSRKGFFVSDDIISDLMEV